MEYAAPVWDPFTASNINKLENTQKFALKVCTKHWNLGDQDLLELTKCPSLESRHLYFKLCTLYKIVHNLVYFPPNVISPKYISVTPEPFLHLPFARTTAYYSSFVPSSDLFGITCLARLSLLYSFVRRMHTRISTVLFV